MKFNSTLEEYTKVESKYSEDIVKNEPMYFDCTVAYAYSNGGVITRDFIDTLHKTLGDDIWSMVFDSRVHMLMKGWFPAIPGYHHDDVPRGENGQPDYETKAYTSTHYLMLVNAEIAPTRFIEDIVEVSNPKSHKIVYKAWHNEIEKQVNAGKLNCSDAKSNIIYKFDSNCFHTCQKAVSNGWRWFGRISCDTDRMINPKNEIRRQVQVYLEFPMEGW